MFLVDLMSWRTIYFTVRAIYYKMSITAKSNLFSANSNYVYDLFLAWICVCVCVCVNSFPWIWNKESVFLCLWISMLELYSSTGVCEMASLHIYI